MKTSNKTKKFLGGIAIAAVSLGCLGLAGIANADTVASTSSGDTTTSGSATTSYPYNSTALSEAMTGSPTITFNIASDQAESNPLTDHHLSFIQLGSYYGKLPKDASATTTKSSPSNFLVVSQSQDVANEIGAWAAANAGYTSADGDPLTWLVSQGKLGTDLSGQANDNNADENIRNLANSLYSDGTSLGSLSTITWKTSSDTTGTWDAPAPGVYLVIDQDGSGNAALPMIISTMPSAGWNVPSTMADLITDQVALKTQDPLTAPVKQFVNGADWTSDGVSGGKLASSDNVTIGAANAVTYQVAGVFPNFYGYPSYTYKYVDTPGTGMTLAINDGTDLAVAGIPISTLMTKSPANSVIVSETTASNPKDTTDSDVTTTADSVSQLSNIKDLFGGSGAQLTVSLNQAALNELITLNAKSTSTTDGDGINTGSALADYKVSAPTSDPQGPDNGAESWTGQTTPTTQYFGLDYQAYLNSSVTSGTTSSTMSSSSSSSSSSSTSSTKAATAAMTDGTTSTATPSSTTESAGITEADNSAYIVNNGTKTTSSGNVPLQSSGSYHGGTTPEGGKTAPTKQTNPDTISGPKKGVPGTTGGVPNKNAVGAGLTWMKIWGSGEVATGAEFQVQNSSGDYLYATGSGWGWTPAEVNAETFEASTPATGANADSDGGLFQISGLGAGTYKVSETQQATGAASIKPSFYITITSGMPETISTSAPSGATATNDFDEVSSYNLVDNTPNGSPFSSNDYHTVENVKSASQLPLTGGAGILTGVIAAVILFGTAGIVLVVYKRRKQQKD